MSEFVHYFVESSRTRWGDPHGAGPVAFTANAAWLLALGIISFVVLRRRLRRGHRIALSVVCLLTSMGLAFSGVVRLWFDLASTVSGVAEFELEHGGLLLVLGPGVPAAIPENGVGLVRRAAMTRAEVLEWISHPKRLLATRTSAIERLALRDRVGTVWQGAGVSVVSSENPWYWRRPMLTWVSATEAELLWETPDAEVGAVRVRSGRRRWVVNEQQARKVHRITIGDLEPATRYTYTLKSSAVPGESEGTFRTLPAPGAQAAVRFAVLGDSGGGHAVTRRLLRRIREFDPDFVLHVGDLAYDRATRASLFAQYYGPVGEVAADVPIWVVPGNHDLLDGGLDLADFFGLEPGSDAAVGYQRVLRTGSVTIAGLNSNAPPIPFSRARRRLADALSSSSEGQFWRIAFFHHPPFPGEGRGRNDLVYWLLQPLLLGANADLAFAGHSHNYQRSMPLGWFDPRSDGVRYIVSGGGGGELREPDQTPETTVRVTAHNAVRVVALGGRLWIEAVDESGTILDRVVFAKDSSGGTVREEAWCDPPASSVLLPTEGPVPRASAAAAGE